LSIGRCHDASETVVSSSVFPNPQQEALTKMLFRFQQTLSAVVLSSKYGFSYLATDFHYYFIYYYCCYYCCVEASYIIFCLAFLKKNVPKLLLLCGGCNG
jgi:hypothetical protein